jgi:hypothetical protein
MIRKELGGENIGMGEVFFRNGNSQRFNAKLFQI